jgi:hypothetical protein
MNRRLIALLCCTATACVQLLGGDEAPRFTIVDSGTRDALGSDGALPFPHGGPIGEDDAGVVQPDATTGGAWCAANRPPNGMCWDFDNDPLFNDWGGLQVSAPNGR